MTSLIQTVTYEAKDAKQLIEKLGEHLGIQKMSISLIGDQAVEGVISEVGRDYICVIEGATDVMIPIASIRYFRYSH